MDSNLFKKPTPEELRAKFEKEDDIKKSFIKAIELGRSILNDSRYSSLREEVEFLKNDVTKNMIEFLGTNIVSQDQYVLNMVKMTSQLKVLLDLLKVCDDAVDLFNINEKVLNG